MDPQVSKTWCRIKGKDVAGTYYPIATDCPDCPPGSWPAGVVIPDSEPATFLTPTAFESLAGLKSKKWRQSLKVMADNQGQPEQPVEAWLRVHAPGMVKPPQAPADNKRKTPTPEHATKDKTVAHYSQDIARMLEGMPLAVGRSLRRYVQYLEHCMTPQQDPCAPDTHLCYECVTAGMPAPVRAAWLKHARVVTGLMESKRLQTDV